MWWTLSHALTSVIFLGAHRTFKLFLYGFKISAFILDLFLNHVNEWIYSFIQVESITTAILSCFLSNSSKQSHPSKSSHMGDLEQQNLL